MGRVHTCKHCKGKFKTYHRSAMYCSNACQQAYQATLIVKRWKSGEFHGNRGSLFALSKSVRRYMLQKHSHKCSRCGWQKKHPTTGKVPLQVHHIDGDATNTIEKNLEVLCPNCHSLTPNYGKLNKVGRWSRRDNAQGKLTKPK